MSRPPVHDDPLWPRHQYVLRWRAPGGRFQTENFHYPNWARRAALNVAASGRATSVRVIRLADGVAVFDQDNEIDLPLGEW